MSAELGHAHDYLLPPDEETLMVGQQSNGSANRTYKFAKRAGSILGLLGIAAMIIRPRHLGGNFRLGVNVASEHPAVVQFVDESRLRMPRGRNSTGSTCSYSFIRFTRDLETFEPPLWKYDSFTEKCVTVMRGSGSWRRYAFTTEEACLAKCGPQPTNDASEQLGPDPQKAQCFTKGPLGVGMGAMCVFPFTYKDTTYTSCTSRDDDGKLWCSTQVDSKGVHEAGFWGECLCVRGNQSVVPPWWIIHDVTPAGPPRDMGEWKSVTFSEEQQEAFGVNEDGHVLNHTQFDMALAALITLPPPPPSPPLRPTVPPLIGGGGLPPWWVLNGIKPAGPERDMGTYNSTTFSEEQQEKYGCDENGTIVDQEQFLEALDVAAMNITLPMNITPSLDMEPLDIAPLPELSPSSIEPPSIGILHGLCSYDKLRFTKDEQTFDKPLWKFDNATSQCVAMQQGSGSWRNYGFASKELCSSMCGPPRKGPSTDKAQCSAESIAGVGAMCAFPFKYRGVVYNECTSKDSDSLWCPTQVDTDLNYLPAFWGKCSCVLMTKEKAVEGQPPASPPWWILRDVVPGGQPKDMGDWNASTFSEEQQDRFGIDEDGYVVNHTRFDLATAALVSVPPVEGLQIPWYVRYGIVPEGSLPQGFGNVSFSQEQQSKFGINEDGEIVDQATWRKTIASMGPPSMSKLPPLPPPPPLPLAGNLSNLTVPGISIRVNPVPFVGPGGIPPWWILHRVKPEGPEKDMGGSTAISFSKEQQKKFGIDEDGNILDEATFLKAVSALRHPSMPPPPPMPKAGNLTSFNFSLNLSGLAVSGVSGDSGTFVEPPPIIPAGLPTPPPLEPPPTVGPGGLPPWWILHGVKPEGPEKDTGDGSTAISFSKEQQMQFGIDEDGNVVDKATFTKAIAELDLPSLPPLSFPVFGNLTSLNLTGPSPPPIIVAPLPTVGPGGLPPWWILHRVKPEGPEKDMGNSTAVSFSAEQQKSFGIDEDGKVVNNTKFQNAMLALTAPAA